MNSKMDASRSDNAAASKADAVSEGWEAMRLIDERTGNSCIGIDFPRRQGGFGFEVFDDDLAEQPKRVREILKKRGAALEGTKEDQIRFMSRLMTKAPAEPLILLPRESGFAQRLRSHVKA
jgi:hypothetical protein